MSVVTWLMKAGSVRSPGVGPGLGLQRLLGAQAEIVGTVFCGDGLVAERPDDVVPEIVVLIESFAPAVVVDGLRAVYRDARA